jgi:hypothetical protein
MHNGRDFSCAPKVRDWRDGGITIAIPSGRHISCVFSILKRLSGQLPCDRIPVVLGRWVKHPIEVGVFGALLDHYDVTVVYSAQRHPPALRNAIIHGITGGHVLFLDDDVVPAVDIVEAARQLIAADPECVYQGPPYLVANPESWYARMEAKVYERGFSSYVRGHSVTLLDARIMLAPHAILSREPFDASLVFGGEGRELAVRLLGCGTELRLASTLTAHHQNRSSLLAVIRQKMMHGRGRGQDLAVNGPKPRSWLQYMRYYARRHFLNVVLDTMGGRMTMAEAAYHVLTNTVFWYGAVSQLICRRSER